MRKFIINMLYEIASAACQLADALAPSNDEVWRERRWKQFDADKAKSWDGPPMVDMRDCDCDMGVGSNPHCLVHGTTDARRN